ncbi:MULTISPECIES: DUF3568 family protein [unclassified Francisella]|uniref:DUF3568 family protein n=1 Tax=unclassified Francisella TaxID=2610885 RepID=UPI002E365DFD|nr:MULTISPECIES: DUF3568 family protein [unclassified Francisella]MED7818524.1 DUF3568 family protein [Francisella sp. 19S2-4]MED7829360.1 DUF3568 family protein [Francisella sp. 19S2-10]
MKYLKSKINLLVVVMVLTLLVSGCSTFGKTHYEDGYFTTTIDQSFDNVYNGSVEAIKNGQTYDLNGDPYDIKINKKMSNEAVIAAESDNNPADFIEIAIEKKTKDQTQISIKYGKNGDPIRSSALIPIIKQNINHK